MAFPRPSSPRAFWQDLKAFFGGSNRHRLFFGALSILMPCLIVAGFYKDSHIEPPPLGIIYVQSYAADRTDAQIVAQQKIDQARLDAYRKKRRQAFQRLEKQLGM